MPLTPVTAKVTLITNKCITCSRFTVKQKTCYTTRGSAPNQKRLEQKLWKRKFNFLKIIYSLYTIMHIDIIQLNTHSTLYHETVETIPLNGPWRSKQREGDTHHRSKKPKLSRTRFVVGKAFHALPHTAQFLGKLPRNWDLVDRNTIRPLANRSQYKYARRTGN